MHALNSHLILHKKLKKIQGHRDIKDDRVVRPLRQGHRRTTQRPDNFRPHRRPHIGKIYNEKPQILP